MIRLLPRTYRFKTPIISSWCFGFLFLLAGHRMGWSCDFCQKGQDPYIKRLADVDLVFTAELYDSYPKFNVLPGEGNGVTKAKVLSQIKPHPVLTDLSKEWILPIYVASAARQQRMQALIYADVEDGKIIPVFSDEVPDAEVLQYLTECVKLLEKPVEEQVPFFYRYLESPNRILAEDAYFFFSITPNEAVINGAPHYNPDLLRSWIETTKSEYAIALYGLMLGACGRPEDEAFFETKIRENGRRWILGLDGLMAGYILANEAKGMELCAATFINPKISHNLNLAAFKALVFQLNRLPSQPLRERYLELLAPGLQIVEVGDLIIRLFLQNQYWKHTATILANYRTKNFQTTMYRQAVLDYALRCPDKVANEFLESLSGEDAHLLQSRCDLLKLMQHSQ